jgi:hypothetical protein
MSGKQDGRDAIGSHVRNVFHHHASERPAGSHVRQVFGDFDTPWRGLLLLRGATETVSTCDLLRRDSRSHDDRVFFEVDARRALHQ